MTGFETKAIHAGQTPDSLTGAVIQPISVSTTFAQPEAGVPISDYDYSRSGNPTRTTLETAVAALEGARFGYAFSSGLAAEDAVLRRLSPGDHVVIPHDAYGGTFRLISKVHAPKGVRYTPVDMSDPDALTDAMTPETKMVWAETPTNPTLAVIDIAAVAERAKAHGALFVVDNTFATPYLQLPLELGADVVVHSTTKYIGGHSDVVGGFVATNDDGVAAEVGFVQNAVGAVPGPFDCYLALRGLKTLGVRMDRHCDNAEKIVGMLRGHPAVAEVFYPDTLVAKKQMKRGGGMISFTATNGEAAALDVIKRTQLFTLAESLGAVESLIEHPGKMTHASAAGSPLEVSSSLVRLSVGIETADDLLADLKQVLDSTV